MNPLRHLIHNPGLRFELELLHCMRDPYRAEFYDRLSASQRELAVPLDRQRYFHAPRWNARSIEEWTDLLGPPLRRVDRPWDDLDGGGPGLAHVGWEFALELWPRLAWRVVHPAEVDPALREIAQMLRSCRCVPRESSAVAPFDPERVRLGEETMSAALSLADSHEFVDGWAPTEEHTVRFGDRVYAAGATYNVVDEWRPM